MSEKYQRLENEANVFDCIYFFCQKRKIHILISLSIITYFFVIWGCSAVGWYYVTKNIGVAIGYGLACGIVIIVSTVNMSMLGYIIGYKLVEYWKEYKDSLTETQV